MRARNWIHAAAWTAVVLGLSACLSQQPVATLAPTTEPSPSPTAGLTPWPTRVPFPPGEIIEYTVQDGDTLPAVAAHFNTSVDEILEANPDVPADVTTLPPGFPLKVPAYYVPLTGSTYHILPDSEFINGPSAVGFDVRTEILRRPGFLAELSNYAYEVQRPAWDVVQVVADYYAINPRLLLALLEYQTQALSDPFPKQDQRAYPMGVIDSEYPGLFWQLVWAAERLNDAYYGWRLGTLREFELIDGFIVRPDPWLNAGTVALQALFADLKGMQDLDHDVGPDGFYQTYQELWGDPFELEVILHPANLQQPELALPFKPGRIWHYSGGPHPSWGDTKPLGALDFAPPATFEGCATSNEWVVAPAAGVISRVDLGLVELDLDGDGDSRTGWVLFFFHVGSSGRASVGQEVELGDQLGHPSCEGGKATGTHVHVARRYNGEWIPAAGVLPFVLEGWEPFEGDQIYEGTLVRGSKVVEACACSTQDNQIIYSLP